MDAFAARSGGAEAASLSGYGTQSACPNSAKPDRRPVAILLQEFRGQVLVRDRRHRLAGVVHADQHDVVRKRHPVDAGVRDPGRMRLRRRPRPRSPDPIRRLSPGQTYRQRYTRRCRHGDIQDVGWRGERAKKYRVRQVRHVSRMRRRPAYVITVVSVHAHVNHPPGRAPCRVTHL